MMENKELLTEEKRVCIDLTLRKYVTLNVPVGMDPEEYSAFYWKKHAQLTELADSVEKMFEYDSQFKNFEAPMYIQEAIKDCKGWRLVNLEIN